MIDPRLKPYADALKKRDKCRELIARQCAINEGLVWDRLDYKVQARYTTLAHSIMATYERVMDGTE